MHSTFQPAMRRYAPVALVACVVTSAAAAPTSPLYPAYAIRTTTGDATGEGLDRSIEAAIADRDFAAEWKDALAFAADVVKNLDMLPAAKLAPASATRLAAKGLQVTTLADLE